MGNNQFSKTRAGGRPYRLTVVSCYGRRNLLLKKQNIEEPNLFKAVISILVCIESKKTANHNKDFCI